MSNNNHSWQTSPSYSTPQFNSPHIAPNSTTPNRYEPYSKPAQQNFSSGANRFEEGDFKERNRGMYHSTMDFNTNTSSDYGASLSSFARRVNENPIN